MSLGKSDKKRSLVFSVPGRKIWTKFELQMHAGWPHNSDIFFENSGGFSDEIKVTVNSAQKDILAPGLIIDLFPDAFDKTTDQLKIEVVDSDPATTIAYYQVIVHALGAQHTFGTVNNPGAGPLLVDLDF